MSKILKHEYFDNLDELLFFINKTKKLKRKDILQITAIPRQNFEDCYELFYWGERIMKQVVKIFTGYNTFLDNNINKFLKEHPDHIINTITLNTRNENMLIIALIVFNVKEPTDSRTVGFTHFGGNNNG